MKKNGAPERWAIIGCGAVFQAFYLEALLQMVAAKRCTVALMVDHDQAQAHASARRFPGAATASDLPGALRSVAIDRALVLTPPATHVALLRELAAAGVNVYCEKPLTVDAAEAQEISALFEDRGLDCHVGFVRRIFPNFRLLKSALVRLDGTVHLSVSDGEIFRWPIRTAGIFDPTQAGGGVVWDKLSHNLDLVQWLAGIESVDRVSSRCRAGQVPVDVLVAGRTRSGTFEIAVSWTDILPNVVRATGHGRVVESKNGLTASVSVAGPAIECPPLAFDVTTYGEGIRACLEACMSRDALHAGPTLATAAESVPLTAFLTQIDARARSIAA